MERLETNLQRHRNLGRLMPDLLHRSIISLSQLFVQFKVVHLDLERRTRREVDTVGVYDRLGRKVEST